MNKEMFDKLSTMGKEQQSIITADDLLIYGCNNRTLLYGYTCERETFHVYIKDKVIHVVVYNNEYSRGEAIPKNMREITVRSNWNYVPDKRLYPERCDYIFCWMLKRKGIDPPFTTFNEGFNWDGPYCGFTLEDAE